MFGSFTVLMREVIRSSRRWRTYALRAGWAAALAVLVAGSYSALDGAEDVAALSALGRTRFIAFVLFQMVLVGLIAPVLVGQGIVEERLDGTLELVAITRLTPARILTGKLLSRLLVIALIVAGGFPILALQLQFGGVSNAKFGAAVSSTVVTIGMMSLVGLVVSLFSRGIVAPAIGGLVFAIPAFGVVPAIATLACNGEYPGLAMLSPLFFSLADAPWQPFVVPLLWAPTAVPLLWLAIVAFRVKLVDGEPAPDDSSAIAWDRFTWWASASATIALLSLPAPVIYTLLYDVAQANTITTVANLSLISSSFDRFPAFVGELVVAAIPYLVPPWVVAAAWAALALHAGTLFYVQLAGRTLDRVEAVLGGSLGSWSLPGARGLRRYLMIEPILWREALTRGAGAITWLSIVGSTGFVVLLAIVGCGGGLDEANVRFALGVFGWMLTTGASSLLAAATFAEERRAQTLELLLLTTLRPWRVAFGKLATTYAQVLPLALLSGLLLASGWQSDSYDLHEHGLFAEPWLQNAWLPRLVAYSGWSATWALGVCAASLTLAMRLRPPQILLPMVLTAPWLVPIAAIVVELVGNAGRARPIPTALVGILVPFAGDSSRCAAGGVPTELFIATALAGGTALIAFLALCVRLRAWVDRDRPG